MFERSAGKVEGLAVRVLKRRKRGEDQRNGSQQSFKKVKKYGRDRLSAG